MSIKGILDDLEKVDSIQNLDVDLKRMEGQKKDENYYRIRIGSYRIGLEIISPKVILITVLSGGDIYKKFPPN